MNVIESWAFLESILPGEVPSLKDKMEGYHFQDKQYRNRVNPLEISGNLWETMRPAKPESEEITFRYYVDCYGQDQLVQLFRAFFKSKEEIVNRSYKRFYSFTFLVNEVGEYVEDSIFIPHVQLIIHDIQKKKIIHYDTFNRRYEEAKRRVEEAASSIFSAGVNLEGIQKLREVFHQHFSVPCWTVNLGYVEINIKKKENESIPHFNSFYIEDLQNILEKGPNATLQQFVEGRPLELDIDENKNKIQQLLSPCKLPLGRWPSPVAQRLSLMQQVAVNQILSGNEKICSVNGPPGTGKTTLLKDVFAQIIVERAIRLVSYKDPTKAFSIKGQMKIDKYNYTMHELDENIAKYSIVVTSSNNGAVENISKDLPKLDAVVRDCNRPTEEERREELAHSGRDLLYEYECEQAYAEESGTLNFFAEISSEVIQTEKTWGLFSAALGRSSNITAVSKALNGVRAKGQLREQPLGKQLEQSLPANAWEEVVGEFNLLLESVERKKAELQQFADLMLQAEDIFAAEKQTAMEIAVTKEHAQQMSMQIKKLEMQKQLINEQLENLPPPTIFEKIIQLFTKKKNKEDAKIRRELHLVIEEQKKLVESSTGNAISLKQLEIKAENIKESIEEITVWKEKYRNQQVMLPTEQFWSKEMYEERQKTVLWQTNELNFERGLLFLKALKVHKTFLMINARPVKAAIAVFSNQQNINLNIAKNREYLANMWNVMHLLFPVMSTTFASFCSMYRGIEKDFIGYLVVDEAGQASPQQAAGALWRSRRAVIVGDPIQIEPVVPVDETILHDIRKAFNLSEAYIGLEASVQTLADYANPVGTYKGEGGACQRIGIPLWVHRRCEEPMFSIANRIAYQNKMVLANQKIGNGQWLDCTGRAVQDQYVREQGQLIVEKIKAHFTTLAEGGATPSIFVITPFTAVKNELKRLVKSKLKSEFPHIGRWADRSIGTVHTFQGKEADIVYFVTGTDTQTDGAANWSCIKPNLLNVAATRAKKEFYVVGDETRFQYKNFYYTIQQTFEEFHEKKHSRLEAHGINQD
ncbi:ATP-binding protein [Sporosarcina sp. Te-1]|uniref:DEAD/DEAH box helicase n=1 Tax=Sporosarcina sp. Te-1 TaxID=2818390 RepID=UPI001A9DFC4E|nr:AAA domain-containing protein [Sporosarcina sp. Te-1]QTD40807.1 ATP-binding domain-containing protein [Sporosarcina sp. Te-1]